MKMRHVAMAVAMMLVPLAAGAAPPPVGSDDWELLSPYAAQIEGATQDGKSWMGCCSIGDGTVADSRIVGDHWQVRLRAFDRFPDAPHGWIDVPPEAVLHEWPNPMLEAIVWWFDGHVRCFAQPGGV